MAALHLKLRPCKAMAKKHEKKKVNLQQLKISSRSRNPYDITQVEQRVSVISSHLHGEKWVLDPR